jgi:hypothetical protein
MEFFGPRPRKGGIASYGVEVSSSGTIWDCKSIGREKYGWRITTGWRNTLSRLLLCASDDLGVKYNLDWQDIGGVEGAFRPEYRHYSSTVAPRRSRQAAQNEVPGAAVMAAQRLNGKGWYVSLAFSRLYTRSRP